MKSKLIEVTPIILCGGSGTRLWPLSRKGFPKQFLSLTGNRSLFQETAQRIANIDGPEIQTAAPIVVAREEDRFLLVEQLREVDIQLGYALLEPTSKNTAPALTLAALEANNRNFDPVLIVSPSDQAIENPEAFYRAVRKAIEEASSGAIVIFGVKPQGPETGYGYIQTKAISSDNNFYDVESFIEKPSAQSAQNFCNDGSYYWNAGILIVKASVWLKALEQFSPDIYFATKKSWDKHSSDEYFVRPDKSLFENIRSDSIDYSVLEHCPGSIFSIKMIELDGGWSDLGSWDSVWGTLPKDEYGNAHFGDVFITKSANTLVYATSRLVSLVGIDSLIVVETPDAVMLVNKFHSQDVKLIVDQLKNNKRQETILHRKVHRPWGWYDNVEKGSRFKVKRIQVKPKASLSLQKHNHRAEHWIVVNGTAEITNGVDFFTLTENQSTYIPVGRLHRLTNPGDVPLDLIEVQTGDYLEEDDIIRISDDYGRVLI